MPAPAENEPVSVVLPVRNAAGVLDAAVGVWLDALGRLGRGYELIVVDDGSADGTADTAEAIAKRRQHVRVLRHESPRGFGASLRTAFAEARHPLVFYTALDYPYTPSDIGKLLTRIAEPDPVFERPLDLVSGCRTGRPVPAGWRVIGFAYRWFCKVALGLQPEPLPGWLGFRNHLRSWLAWVLLGVPLVDVNSAFKLFRRALLDRYPVQSDGGFVHAELVAKATFTTCLMDEVPLTPNPAPIPPVEWNEFGRVFRNARFNPSPSPAAILPSPSTGEG